MTRLDPIVLQTPLSDEQERAVGTSGDVAVTAGAGAGKTRTLVARYLSLLASGLSPRSVVAITFTKKAAREMRNRARHQVRRYLEQDDLAPDVRARWQDVYNALDAARIGTIHSLCGEILRHHPAKARIDPRFEMLDEGQMAVLQAQAVDEALAWAADDVGAARLFADWGERELRNILSRLLALRLDVQSVRGTLPDDLWGKVWEPRLSSVICGFVDDDQVRACFAELSALRSNGTLARADAAGDALAPLLGNLLSSWDAILAARAERDWATIASHLAPLRATLKQKGRKANWAPAEPKATIKELQRHYDARLADLMVRSGKASPISLELDRRLAQEALPQLLRVVDWALSRYAKAKRERPALDFDDLEAQALRLLRDDRAVCAYWQGIVRALLVDEFQDTNSRQRDLLDLINGDGGKLFIVGDGKQSIYRFRGADVTVFRQKRRDIDALGQAFDLATSYRAHKALIEGLNGLLESVLGAEEDPARPYVEPFSAIAYQREAPASGFLPPFIELHVSVGAKNKGALDHAARALVARLTDLVEGGQITVEESDPDDGQERVRPLNYGHIAILCRATRSFAAYEGAMEAAGVPFLTVSGRGFYERAEVRDVLVALHALADPVDDLTLAGLLRSPACGLSDMALYRLVERRCRQGASSLWAVLCEDDLTCLADEAGLGKQAHDLIARLHGMVGRVPVADVLKEFLDATGYRAALLRAGQARGARNVAKLLSDAYTSDIVGIGAFLEYVAQLRDVGTREGEAHTVAMGAVQVMSVHAAKGLEFPVVVIGDAGRRSPRTRGLLIDPELGVLPPYSDERIADSAESRPEVQKASSGIYRLAQRSAQDQEAAESDRLLYVAATRAKEMLLISGVVTRSPDGWLKRLDAVLGLGDVLKQSGREHAAVRSETLVGGQPIARSIYPIESGVAPHAARLATPVAPLALPEALPMLQTLVPETVVADEESREKALDPPRRVWRVVPEKAVAPPWVVGKIVHSALEQWVFADDQKRDLYAWAAAEARGHGMTDRDEVRDAVRRAAEIMTRFQTTSLYERIDGAAQRFHEVPYSVIDDAGQLEHGVIDALFRDETGWALVEFKTDYIKGPEALKTKLGTADYVPQVARYVAAAERMLGDRPRPILCLLNYSGAVRTVEDRW